MSSSQPYASIPLQSFEARHSQDFDKFAASSSGLVGGQSAERERYEEDRPAESWDVFADFNNAGPRYSERDGQPFLPPVSTSPPPPPIAPEWKRDSTYRELSDASAKDRLSAGYDTAPMLLNREKKEKMPWGLHRKQNGHRVCMRVRLHIFLIFFTFIFLICLGITLYFLIPRLPSYAFTVTQPFTMPSDATNDSIEFSTLPANFSMPLSVQLQADTAGTYLPVHVTSLQATVYDVSTDKKVGKGSWKDTFPAKTLKTFEMPLEISYQAVNSTETTWVRWHDACAAIDSTGATTRPTLYLRLILVSKATGVVGSSTSSVDISNIVCP
ncbi:hypothetical protein [Phaffia rhodozyma]|uniref:Uncharacterized protein n=1 Tax=Phaffia rhodozyma TaxID=264483 RepID=A0A0F7SYW9_PHARH|nr:hypothetical protein [Phaffia rhodozyma]